MIWCYLSIIHLLLFKFLSLVRPVPLSLSRLAANKSCCPEASMPVYIRDPLPTISAHMSFYQDPDCAPIIAARMEFTDTYLIRSSDTNDSSQPRNVQISKPPGEPGRPNSGGYCLETKLLANGVSKAMYDKIWVRPSLKFIRFTSLII